MNNKSTIYSIKNKINGKHYVGQTTRSVKRRMSEHLSLRNSKKHFHYPLYKDMRKYGVNNFLHEILEEEVAYVDIAERETYYINKLDSINNGYNQINGGGGGFGTKHKLISEKDVAYIINLYDKEEMTTEEIADELGTTKELIGTRLRDSGIELTRGPKSVEEMSITVKKEGVATEYRVAADFVDYLLDNNIPSTKERRSVVAGVNNVLKGRRKSYLGYKIRYKNQIED